MYISANLDDKSDILSRSRSLCGKINNVLCQFSNRDLFVQVILLRNFCCDFMAAPCGIWPTQALRICSGAGTSLKVGGTGPERKWGGHRSVPLHFLALTAQLVVLVSAFVTVSSLASFLFAALQLTVPPCPAICKSGGHVSPVPHGVGATEDLCVAWREGLRRMWGLPYRTHSVLLAPLCDMLPLEYELMYRTGVLIRKCLDSENMVVSNVTRDGIFFQRIKSPIGRIVQCWSNFVGHSVHNMPVSACGWQPAYLSF